MTRSIIDCGITYPGTVVWIPEEHPYGPEDPSPYLLEVSHGIMYKLCMGAATVPFSKGALWTVQVRWRTASKHVHGLLS